MESVDPVRGFTMWKELSAVELTAIKVVEESLKIAFCGSGNPELMFANRVSSIIQPDIPADRSTQQRKATVHLEGVYRQFNPFQQGKVRSIVYLDATFVPREKDGVAAGHFMIWVPDRVQMGCDGEWIPEPRDFVGAWDKGVGEKKFAVNVYRPLYSRD